MTPAVLSGKLVFASGKSGDYDLWRLDLSEGQISQLTVSDSWNDEPRWSPDGQWILYTSRRSGVPEVYLMDERGNRQQQLTSSGKYHRTPVWMPDGRHYVVVANYAGNFDLWLMDIKQKEAPQQLTDYPEDDYDPDVSRDGRAIVFTSKRNGNDDVWLMEAATKKITRLTTHDARDYNPRFSPNGDRIAFVSERTTQLLDPLGQPNVDIYTIRQDGGGLRRLTSQAGVDRSACWSPEGAHIIFTSAKANQVSERLMVLHATGGVPVPLSIDREPLERELGVSLTDYMNPLFALLWNLNLLPETVLRKTYPEDYWGTERHPDWAK